MVTPKIKFSFLAIAVLAIVFASCSGKKSNVPVPANAALVFHFDGASLNSKLSWDEIKNSEWFKKLKEQADNSDETAKKLMENPEESGLNTKSDFYFFLTPRGRGGYMAAICNISDVKKFEDFLQKVSQGEKIEKGSGFSYMGEDEALLTWNDKKLVFVVDNPDINSAGSFSGSSRQQRFEKDSLIAIAKEIYDLKGKKSLGNNSKFSSLLNDKGDMHFWVNAGSLYSNAMPAILALTKASLLFEGNISTGSLSFENGKIIIKGKNYYNKEIAAIYKKVSDKTLNEDMLRKIPAGNVAAAMAFSFPPEVIKEFITLMGVDGLANMALAETGLTIDDFIKATKGDMLLSVSDFTVAEKEKKIEMGSGEEPYVYKTTEPDAKILFSTSIGDKSAFDRLTEAIKDMISKKAGEEASNEIMNKVPYTVKDNWFITGNDSVTMNSYGSAKTEHPFISKIKGHPMGGYIDIQKFISGSKPSFADDKLANIIADESLKTWQDIVFYGGEFKNDATESHGEINFVDKNTNSLKLLNNYLGFIVVKIMEEEKRKSEEVKLMEKEIKIDNLNTFPVNK